MFRYLFILRGTCWRRVSGRTKKTTLKDGVVSNSWGTNIAVDWVKLQQAGSRYQNFVYVPQLVVDVTLLWTKYTSLQLINIAHTPNKVLSAAYRLLLRIDYCSV